MQARGEVMELEACASATGRGRNAAPARAAGLVSIAAARPSNPVEKPEVEPRLRIALWSDGQLQIVRPGGHTVVFKREETRQLVEYLDSIALDGVRSEKA